jgi:hypothetical protein
MNRIWVFEEGLENAVYHNCKLSIRKYLEIQLEAFGHMGIMKNI